MNIHGIVYAVPGFQISDINLLYGKFWGAKQLVTCDR